MQLSFRELFGESLDEYEAWFVSRSDEYWDEEWRKRCEGVARLERQIAVRFQRSRARFKKKLRAVCRAVRLSNWSKETRRRLKREGRENDFNRQNFRTFSKGEEV